MTARFRFFRAERWAKGINLAQGHGSRFDIKLARLREIRLLFKIVDREKGGGALACGRSDDRGVSQGEAVVVEEIAGSLDDLGAHTKNGGLALRAHPEMAVLHQ